MKKFMYCLMVLAMAFSVTGCGGEKPLETKMTPEEMAKAVTESQSGLPALKQTISGDEDFASWISDYYEIDTGLIEDGAVYYAEGVEAGEVAVLLVGDEKDTETVQNALKQYKEGRKEVFEGYAPKQAALAENGTVTVNGRYVSLFICEDTSAAKAAFLNCFGEQAKTSSRKNEISGADTSNPSGQVEDSPEEKTKNGYDSVAVLQAWESGDSSSLSERDSRILEGAKKVITQEIKENMSDYEKELAIHDWITGWSEFDYGIFGRSSDEIEDGSDTPYGVLIDRSAMCQGYSSTFQLFMDMLKIECITVFGKPNSGGVQHSWNMVRLDGEWYCVDVAWDDPIGGSPGHTYFNATSEEFRGDGIHNWDDSSVPEAAGTKYSYK